MYIGKSLSIHGRIHSFSRAERHVDIKFENFCGTLSIVCQVADDDSLQYLEIGHYVVVNGIMSEFLRFRDIVLKDCTVPSLSQMAENSHWRGTYLKANQNYEGALEEVKRAIDLKPDYLEAYNQLVYIYRAMDYKGEAFYQAERAAELYPLDTKFHLILGNIALYSYEDTLDDRARYCRDVDCMLEGYKNAEQEFSQAFELDSDLLEALDGLGTTYMWLARHFECHKHARSCEHGRPDMKVANEYYSKAIDSYTALIDVSVAGGSGQVDEWLFDPPLRYENHNAQYSPRTIGHIRRSGIYEMLGQIDNANQDLSIGCSIDKTWLACRSAP